MSYGLPFIQYRNVLVDGTVTVTSEESGYPKENLWDWQDSTLWKATSAGDQNIDIDKGAAGTAVNTLCVLGHNWGSAGDSVGCQVTVYDDDNPSFSSPATLGTVSIEDDIPFYLSLTAGSQRYNRIKIANFDEAPYAAVVVLGSRLEIPVGPDFSFDPDKQNIRSETYNSYAGRVLASSIQYAERQMEVPFRRLAQSFVSATLLPFLEDHYGMMLPFFFVPDPGDVFGTDKVYYLIAPKNPTIELPVWEDDISYRNWTLKANGMRQSTFR